MNHGDYSSQATRCLPVMEPNGTLFSTKNPPLKPVLSRTRIYPAHIMTHCLLSAFSSPSDQFRSEMGWDVYSDINLPTFRTNLLLNIQGRSFSHSEGAGVSSGLKVEATNVATTRKIRFFTLKAEEKANFRWLSFTGSAWLQEKWLLVNSYWIRIFRKL